MLGQSDFWSRHSGTQGFHSGGTPHLGVQALYSLAACQKHFSIVWTKCRNALRIFVASNHRFIFSRLMCLKLAVSISVCISMFQNDGPPEKWSHGLSFRSQNNQSFVGPLPHFCHSPIGTAPSALLLHRAISFPLPFDDPRWLWQSAQRTEPLILIWKFSKGKVPPNHPSHKTILVLKSMVTWGYLLVIPSN